MIEERGTLFHITDNLNFILHNLNLHYTKSIIWGWVKNEHRRETVEKYEVIISKIESTQKNIKNQQSDGQNQNTQFNTNLNINGLNSPLKRHRLTEWTKIEIPFFLTSKRQAYIETQAPPWRTRLNKIIPIKWNQKESQYHYPNIWQKKTLN